MPRISAVNVAEYAWAAGFRGTDLVRATAHGLAESGGPPFFTANTEAENRCCVGLMQINVLVHTQYSREQMKNPAANMQAAFALWKRDGWRPWDSSRTGMMLAWPVAAEAAGRVTGRTPGRALQQGATVAGQAAGVASATTGIDAIANVVQFFTVGRNWGRIGEIALGGVLLVIALQILARPVTEPIVRTAAKGARLAATKGA